jgi:hypothetical protein
MEQAICLTPISTTAAEIYTLRTVPFSRIPICQVLPSRRHPSARSGAGHPAAGRGRGAGFDPECRAASVPPHPSSWARAPAVFFQQAIQSRLAHFQRIGRGNAGLFQNRTGYRIAFRVNGGGIQRLIAITNAQEAGRLLKGFWPKTWHVAQFLARAEWAVFLAIGDDAFGQFRPDPGNMREQGRAGGVHLHAHRVHHTLDHAFQRVRKGCLIHVVLV